MSSKPFRRKSNGDWKKKSNQAAAEALLPPKQFKGALLPVPNLATFIRDGWHVLEPATPLEWNWHIDAVALHLQAALEDWMAVQVWRQNQQDPNLTAIAGVGGAQQAAQDTLRANDEKPFQRIQNLLINIPPGTAKSRIVSVFMPAWMWLRWPAFKFIFLSSNPRVSQRDSVACRDVIESKWYQDTFRPDWTFAADQNAKNLYKNTAFGWRAAFGFGARITGDRADAIIWDDPHDADEVHSVLARQHVLDRWDGAIGNRVNDLRSSLRIGVMQRLHEEDLSGHVLKQGKWEHLCLPMEWEATKACSCPSCARGETSIGWRDPREFSDEKLLFPQRFTPEVLAAELIRLKPSGYAGQMQQRPTPAGGDIFKETWWRFWVPKGVTLPPPRFKKPDGSIHEAEVIELPDEFDEHLQSWDMAFKETKDSDYVCGGVWSKKGSLKFLRDQVRERMDFTKTLGAVVDLCQKWPEARRVLIEGKANGPAVISALKGKITGLVEVEPEGGKEARAHAITPDIEGGDVYLPHPKLHELSDAFYKTFTWVNAFISECTNFPRGTNDDQVDEMTQALTRWMTKKKRSYTPGFS